MSAKQITRLAEIKSENLNWKAIGKRFGSFRRHSALSCIEVGKIIGWQETGVEAFESGYSSRTTVNLIWIISNAWNLSLNWLINGIGNFYDSDPVELLPETLLMTRGAGIRRNTQRKEAEEGEYTGDMMEFVMAIDKYKVQNNIGFPTWTQIYEIILALGYRKAVPARISPLGYNSEYQNWSEKLKQFQEIDQEIKNEEEKEAHHRQKLELENHHKKMANIPAKFLHDPTLSSRERLRRLKVSEATKGRRNIKQYIITDPNGRTYLTDKGLNDFCRQHGLDSNNLSAVATGRRKHHRKWTAKHAPEFASKC